MMYSEALPAAPHVGRAGAGPEAGITPTPGTEGEHAGPGRTCCVGACLCMPVYGSGPTELLADMESGHTGLGKSLSE